MTARKPTAIKMLEGTYRRDRANPAEPKPDVGAEPPPRLPPDGPAREAWQRLAPVLTSTRVLTEADADALALGCLALEEFLAARDDPVSWRRAADAWKRYAAALAAFGMNPTARTRVAAQPVPVEDDAFDAWLARRTTRTPMPTTPRPKPAAPRGGSPKEPA